MIKDLSKINGNEIIKFLNKESKNNDYLCDISICPGSFVFEKQTFGKKDYKLYFTANYNNWGTEQAISDNYLLINNEEVKFVLNEPFYGDGTDDELKTVMEKWLDKHEFDPHAEEKFNSILKDSYEKLAEVSFKDKTKMEKIIQNLIKAKTYMK